MRWCMPEMAIDRIPMRIVYSSTYGDDIYTSAMRSFDIAV